MSVVLEYPAAGKDVGQLHDQLRAAGLVPERVEIRGDVVLTPGENGAAGTETRVFTIVLTMPDGTSEAAVAALVAGHVPQARYEPAARMAKVRAIRQRERVRGDYERAKTQASGATNLAQLRDAVLTVLEAKRA